jgi:hypothetical protein
VARFSVCFVWGKHTESCPAEKNSTQAVYCGIFVGKLVAFGINVPFTALEALLSVVKAELETLSTENVLRGVLRLTAAPEHNRIQIPDKAQRRRSVLSRHAMVGMGALLVAVLVGTVVVLRCLSEYTSYTVAPSKSLEQSTKFTTRSHWAALSGLNWTMGRRTNPTDDDDATQATTGGYSRTSAGWFNNATTLTHLPIGSSHTVHIGRGQSSSSSWAISGPMRPLQKAVVSSRPYHEVDSIYIVEPDNEDDDNEPVEWQGEYGADPLSLATQWPNTVVDVW